MIRTLLGAAAFALSVMPSALAQSDPATVAAEAAAEFGPAIGHAAPAFAVTDATGVERTLANLSGPQGVVIYFNRSLDWCPICLRQTLEVEAAREAFEDAGWSVAVLTYDTQETLARVADQRQLSLTLLADEGSAVIDAFDVRDPIYADPDHMAHGVPYPIAFAIRPDGTVAGKYWHEAGLGGQRGYATRVSTDDVIAALGEG
jgi:peroxiredoxin